MKKIAIIYLILFSFELQSQDSFTLNQAIEFGLINNSMSKNAANDVKIANAKNGKQLPLVFLKSVLLLNIITTSNNQYL